MIFCDRIVFFVVIFPQNVFFVAILWPNRKNCARESHFLVTFFGGVCLVYTHEKFAFWPENAPKIHPNLSKKHEKTLILGQKWPKIAQKQPFLPIFSPFLVIFGPFFHANFTKYFQNFTNFSTCHPRPFSRKNHPKTTILMKKSCANVRKTLICEQKQAFGHFFTHFCDAKLHFSCVTPFLGRKFPCVTVIWPQMVPFLNMTRIFGGRAPAFPVIQSRCGTKNARSAKFHTKKGSPHLLAHIFVVKIGVPGPRQQNSVRCS